MKGLILRMLSEQMISADQSFLGNHGKVAWWPLPDLVQHYCQFDQNFYQDHMFDSLGVVCPESVRKSVAKRRSEFLAGRYCAMQALAEVGYFPKCIGVGKQREPVWPVGVMGAISHTTGLATSVVSSNPACRGIGIDVELTVEPSTMEKIIKHILPLESFSILKQPGLRPEEIFTLIFSVKESFYKSAYPRVRRFFDFSAAKVVEVDLQKQRITFRVTENLCEGLTIGTEVYGYYYQFSDDLWATMVAL